jgi:hypothetical protein
MKRRNERHIGRHQKRRQAREVERRRKRKALSYRELLKDQRIPSPRMIAKVKARYAMLEAIAEERKAEAPRLDGFAAATHEAAA